MCNLTTSSPFTPEMILFVGWVSSANGISYLASFLSYLCSFQDGPDWHAEHDCFVLFPCSLTVNLGTLGNINDALNCLK